ncbi:FAD-dependent oxidoreductase [Variovorax dokdonensis]|uniref:FAD-dependent oxidoreductase n=1 Tax=Variovorax dokdonensis TaxID=344883 RepID=A0ABT7N9T7_9BURK|nr:FAD-dependent oxidoreductase [Variovorax dokdonensis]MDM0044691.1 FAD-dependent oxidoreductase [Variovorax dokdonensis]
MSDTQEAFRFAKPYELPHWPFQTPPELLNPDAPVARHPIVIVGAGLSGLTLACDLAQRGIKSVLLDEDDTVGVRGASSRGICYAQKSLEIFARLGIYERIVAKGITWSLGRTFSGDEEVYSFNLQTESCSEQPPFINLQQFYVEWFLVERILELGMTDLRWKSRVGKVEPLADGSGVCVEVQTPAGSYMIEAEHLVDATGAHSPIREQLGVACHVSRSTDRWCISDVRFTKPLPVERWTWVDAPFNEGRAVWQHLMGDGVWRMDYQMREDCDPEEISRPEVAGARLREQLGPDVEFEFVWIGPYGYRDHLLERFREGRVLFIGDAAHVVSPFGARGGNSGIQDAANLAWKLALVVEGRAADALLDSYEAERRPTAAQNLQVTSRSARFLAPRSEMEHMLREAVVALAPRHAFARAMVNTGRMSAPNPYPPAPLLPDGAVSVQNLPLLLDGEATSIARLLQGSTHCLGLLVSPTATQAEAFGREVATRMPIRVLAISGEGPLPTLAQDDVLLHQLGDPPNGSLVLLRPDAYRCACLTDATPAKLTTLMRQALALRPAAGCDG